MRHRGRLFGLMGLLSLLGVIGVVTEERTFLAFFAFAVDFQYCFLKSDEMLETALIRSAAWGFYAGMAVTAMATLLGVFWGQESGDPGAGWRRG